jgi:hypothetical protein
MPLEDDIVSTVVIQGLNSASISIHMEKDSFHTSSTNFSIRRVLSTDCKPLKANH